MLNTMKNIFLNGLNNIAPMEQAFEIETASKSKLIK